MTSNYAALPLRKPTLKHKSSIDTEDLNLSEQGLELEGLESKDDDELELDEVESLLLKESESKERVELAGDENEDENDNLIPSNNFVPSSRKLKKSIWVSSSSYRFIDFC